MKLTILGCGTSGGVPKLPEHWGACDPDNPKNRRRRASVLIEDRDTRILIDTSPDLRMQMLDAGVRSLDAVFYTHDHADHTHGIDDLRGFFQAGRQRVPVYGDAATISVLRQRFGYIFTPVAGYPAICDAHVMDGAVTIGSITMLPFTQGHGQGISYGFRFGDMAYSTDLNHLDEKAFEALAGVRLWVVDALRYDPHPTHAHLDLTLGWIDRVGPDRAVLTHMTWDMDYDSLRARLPAGVEPAYDGMVLTL
ncbi:MBL fold metallo-hydrolase [Eilatimonas milleporae]|uniref:Phosphoribosyl 1,2-cyclic phosphate phosphodiesterase n=1 Tax=Eilatimonas milleporae TaxID=911205 RepID=A0A3M0CPK1_9PROT|nr:MBL fold metallo-hydrolase [Eilatimonas milleporae]RMB08706.1 phosphoribosyl 1,2-cyclic phosphate phosphodiesterase [Eilatimonas milleporae]